MTYGETVDVIKAKQKQEEAEIKKQSVHSYNVARLVRDAIASCFSKNSRFPTINEAFPGLFKEEFKTSQQDWRIAKERLLDYANYVNKKRGEDH